MKEKYRILERTWSNGKKDYEVQEYSKKWYSKKYKWRTTKRLFSSLSGIWKEPATFSSIEEAERFIKENRLRIIRVKDVGIYES